MGSIGKKPIIGYRYKMGLLAIPCLKADGIIALKFGDKIGWQGMNKGGALIVNKPSLFGGKKKEGGVSGQIDVQLGGPTQVKNEYLQRVLGGVIPAYRGFVSLVFRQFYWGNNPYIKPWSVKPVAIACHSGNWYPEKAYISLSATVQETSIYIALDASLSMAGSKMAAQINAVRGFVLGLKGSRNNIKIVIWNTTITHRIERLDAMDSDYDDIAAWLLLRTGDTAYGTFFNAAVSEAATFFADADNTEDFLDTTFGSVISAPGVGVEGTQSKPRRVLVFLTDGIPEPGTAETAAATLAGISSVEVFCINIVESDTTYTELLDNTPDDGVPVVSGDAQDIAVAIGRGFVKHVDMNPAHIIRDVKIDPESGGSGDATEIDEDNYMAVADRLYDEGFGLTFFWDDGNAPGFIEEIERHIDAATYVDRRTGKEKIKLIRDDYDIDDLPVFTRQMIKEWVEPPTFPQYEELPNYLTLKYTKRDDGEVASLSLGNTAGIILRGGTETKSVDYRGITVPTLAARVLERDLPVVTTPLISGAFRAIYASPDLNRGDAIIVEDASVNLPPTVMRIREIKESVGADSSVVIRVTQDKWALGQIASTGDPDEEGVTSPALAEPATARVVEEASYYQIVLALGQMSVDTALADDDTLGYLSVAAGQPNTEHIDFTAATDVGAGWINAGQDVFSPSSALLQNVSDEADFDTFDISKNESLAAVEDGSLCVIGTEVMRIDNMTAVDDVVTITVGRGCLDTVPDEHPTGDAIIFLQSPILPDTIYVDGESIAVKLLTQTSVDVLSFRRAPEDTVVMNSRAARPYAPGNFKVNGSYASGSFLNDAALTWAHRNRLAQTTLDVEDHTWGNIGPEAGVTYIVRAIALGSSGEALSTVIETNVGTDTNYDYDDTTVLPPGTVELQFSVTSLRDGLESWQSPTIRMLAGNFRGLEDSPDYRGTFDGGIRALED